MARNIHTKNSISPWPFIRNKSEIAYEWEIFPAFLIYHHHPAERKIPKVAAPQQYKEEAVQTGTSNPPKEILPVEMNSKRIRIPSFASQLATLRNSSTGTQLQIAPMYFLLPLPSVYSFQWTVRGTQRYQEKLLFKNEIRHLPFPLSSTLYPNCSLSAGPTCHPMTSP